MQDEKQADVKIDNHRTRPDHHSRPGAEGVEAQSAPTAYLRDL
jgi:hypothetical protein